LAPNAVGFGVEPVDERHSDLGRQRTADADHAQVVDPVAELTGVVLPGVEVVDVEALEPALAGRVAQRLEVRRGGQPGQFGLRAGTRSLGSGDLASLGQRQRAVHQRGLGGRAVLEGVGHFDGTRSLSRGRARSPGQPLVRVAKSGLAVRPTTGRSRCRPGPRSGARLGGERQLLGQKATVFAAHQRRVEERQPVPQLTCSTNQVC